MKKYYYNCQFNFRTELRFLFYFLDKKILMEVPNEIIKNTLVLRCVYNIFEFTNKQNINEKL